jgi:hypothetical protein
VALTPIRRVPPLVAEIDQAHRFFCSLSRSHAGCDHALSRSPGSRQFHAAQVPLAILTNKPVRSGERLIEGLKLMRTFRLRRK